MKEEGKMGKAEDGGRRTEVGGHPSSLRYAETGPSSPDTSGYAGRGGRNMEDGVW